MKVKIALLQSPSDLGDVAGNTKRLSRMAEEAAVQGAKIIVMPETSVTGYLSQDLKTNWQVPGMPIEPCYQGRNPSAFAESVPGPSTRHFCALSKRLGVYLTVPLLEVDVWTKRENGVLKEKKFYYNTICLVSPRGEIVGHYRKLYPWPFPEKSWATPGDRGPQPVDTEYGRVGLAICFDIHNIMEDYKPHKIWALLYPIAWVDQEHPLPWFTRELPSRVKRYGHYLLGANWSLDREPDPKAPWYGYGYSTAISPKGEVLAQAKTRVGEEIIYVEIPTQWAMQD